MGASFVFLSPFDFHQRTDTCQSMYNILRVFVVKYDKANFTV
jgi:hypothetical protein